MTFTSPFQPEWSEQAGCRDKPSDWFFPERGKNTRKAAKVCAECPLLDMCDEYATATGSVGFWAGRMRDYKTEEVDATRTCAEGDSRVQSSGEAAGTELGGSQSVELEVSGSIPADPGPTYVEGLVA